MENIKFLEHTADVKFQAKGDSLEQAFVNSALALKQTIVKDMKIKNTKEKNIEINGNDLENLLYNFLEEFLYLLDAEDFILGEVKNLKIKDKKLTCITAGDKFSNYKITNDVKAITYNEMFVQKKKQQWTCQVVLDV